MRHYQLLRRHGLPVRGPDFVDDDLVARVLRGAQTDRPLTRAERLWVVEGLYRQQLRDARIAERAGLSRSTVCKIRRFLGLAALRQPAWPT